MMTLDETIQHINKIVDSLLVMLAEKPETRFLIDLPSLVEGEKVVPVLDCQEYNYAIAQLREVLTYKYLLCAFRSKLLPISRESLAACLRCLRSSPVIDYYDLGDYHEFAFYLYKKEGKEKKSLRHLLSCYYDRGRAILSAGKTFDSKDLILILLKDHQRMRSFLLYVISFVRHDFAEVQSFLKRSQYLLLERAMVLAVKLFAENPAYDAEVRSCIYHALSSYYEKTNRREEAKQAREACRKLGGKRNYDAVLMRFIQSQAAPSRMDVCFLDMLLYADSIDEAEIYPIDEEGNLNMDEEERNPIMRKDGRSNFLETFYRPMPSAMIIKKLYEKAEQGNLEAIREIARRYHEGDGVTACEFASQAWEKKAE